MSGRSLTSEYELTVTDALYFSLATMSTVGYGDIFPPDRETRFFTCIMIGVGVLAVMPQVASAVVFVTNPITCKGRALLEYLFPREKVDLDHDGEVDYVVVRHALLYYPKNLLPSLLLNVVLQFVSAVVFTQLEEAWTLGDAMYHCLVTATTVGYGDTFIATQSGRLFACLNILLSVAMLGEMIQTIDTLRLERAIEVRTWNQLKKQFSNDFLSEMQKRARELRPLVKDHDEGITEPEFVLATLVELDIVSAKELRPFIKQFRKFDISNNGQLSEQDLKLTQSLSPENLIALRKKNAAQRSASRLVKVAWPGT